MEISFNCRITIGNINQAVQTGTPLTINVNTNMESKSISSSSRSYDDEDESYRKLMRRYVRGTSA